MIVVYGQRSAVRESLVADDQARSVGRLTVLAGVLVPFTLAAEISSMSVEFAAAVLGFLGGGDSAGERVVGLGVCG